MKLTFAVVAVALFCATARADTISTNAAPVVIGTPHPVPVSTASKPETWTTTDGKTYTDVKVIRVEADSVTILYADGGARIDLAKLPGDLQKRFGYDPAKAQAAAEARENAEQQNALALEAQQKATTEKMAKDAIAEAAANSKIALAAEKVKIQSEINGLEKALDFLRANQYETWVYVDGDYERAPATKAQVANSVLIGEDQRKVDALKLRLQQIDDLQYPHHP